DWEVDARVSADLALPLRTYRGEVIGERVRRAGAVRAVDRGDLRGGQVELRVQLLDRGGVPGGDLPEIDVRDDRPVQTQPPVQTRQVVRNRHAGECPRNDDATVAGSELVRREWRVRGAEVHGPRRDLG